MQNIKDYCKGRPLKTPTIKISQAAQICRDQGLSPAPQVLEDVVPYTNLLLKWSRTHNLIGIKDPERAFAELVCDGLHVAGFVQGLGLPAEVLSFDLGAGAGLPGIPLRLVWTQGRYVLIEVRQKRTVFLRYALMKTAVKGTELFAGRAEDAFEQFGRPGLVVSRAFKPLPELLEFVSGGIAPQGVVAFLASAEPTTRSIPPKWRMRAVEKYKAGEKDRYCLFLTPARVSR